LIKPSLILCPIALLN